MKDLFEPGHVYKVTQGKRHQVLRREGRVVLAESSPCGFEVFRLKHNHARVIAGNSIEESMGPPSNNEWGSPRGVTVMYKARAEARFAEWVSQDNEITH